MNISLKRFHFREKRLLNSCKSNVSFCTLDFPKKTIIEKAKKYLVTHYSILCRNKN